VSKQDDEPKSERRPRRYYGQRIEDGRAAFDRGDPPPPCGTAERRGWEHQQGRQARPAGRAPTNLERWVAGYAGYHLGRALPLPGTPERGGYEQAAGRRPLGRA